jgi:gliding motility-associated transport system ATP-binding protein
MPPSGTNPARVVLRAQGLSRRYGDLLALAPQDLSLQHGEILGLLGTNGAGKSTTLQLITGNLAPSSGRVTICDHDLLSSPLEAKRRVGYLPETPPLYADLTVREYLGYAAQLRQLPRSERASAIDEAVGRCGLGDVLNKLIVNLSKGFKQRVGLAQAIVHSPEVLILDEPTVGLDPIQIREIRALVRELGEAHAVIFSSHVLSEVQELCSRVHILNAGRPVFEGQLRDLDGGDEIQLKTDRVLDTAVLMNIPGVDEIDGEGKDYRIRPTEGAHPEPDIAAAVVRQGAGLLRITRERRSLEHLFVELTQAIPQSQAGEDAA